MGAGFIYGLHVDGGPIRYIGQSINPEQRLASITDLRKGRACGPLLKAWVFRNVGRVRLQLIEQCDNMDDRERFWISRLRGENVALLNVQPGGSHSKSDAANALLLMEQLRSHWRHCLPDPEDVLTLDELIRQSQQTVARLNQLAKKRRRARR